LGILECKSCGLFPNSTEMMINLWRPVPNFMWIKTIKSCSDQIQNSDLFEPRQQANANIVPRLSCSSIRFTEFDCWDLRLPSALSIRLRYQVFRPQKIGSSKDIISPIPFQAQICIKVQPGIHPNSTIHTAAIQLVLLQPLLLHGTKALFRGYSAHRTQQ